MERHWASEDLIVELPRGEDLGDLERAGGIRSLEQPEAAVLETGEDLETRAWLVRSPDAKLHPWDAAHRALAERDFLPGRRRVRFAEPDRIQSFPYVRGAPGQLEASDACQVRQPSDDWKPSDLAFAWHLEDGFSGLRAARARVGEVAGSQVRVAILDTGYDPGHTTCPQNLRLDLAANFVDDDRPTDARDPAIELEDLLRNPGHGTATLALLAGARIQPLEFEEFDDYLGGAPHSEVVAVRIANSVIHILTSAMTRGIDHAVSVGCDVVSISMGGVPARSWARAVNRAYEAGTAIFAAGGNNLGGLPTTSLVYPARFYRVVAVCGATAEKRPYFKHVGYPGMQGNFGPPGKMRSALAAFTPNVTWAEIGCGNVVSLDGAGTSSATPQVAAAAALWLAHHQVAREHGWRRVEAVRHALFESADRSHPDLAREFGNGLLRANHALDIAPDMNRRKVRKDRVWFPWIRLLFGLEAAPDARQEMLELEALQLYLTSSQAQEIADGADPDEDELDATTARRLIGVLARDPKVSNTLREALLDATRTS